MADNKLHFRANARLKDLLGRGLILSDNVAIIELIKNASDANSGEVLIEFDGADNKSPLSKISVQDFGEGMSYRDFETKWLNIAFSGKRDQLNDGRSYAGEKGVGRFSCDRLGEKLHLISKKEGYEPFEAQVDWRDFEVNDIDAEISTIDIQARVISDSEYTKLTGGIASRCGTVLIISSLRSVWNHEKLDDLNKELERFIIDPEKRFSVRLKSLDIIDKKDKSLVFDHYIENKLFEKIDDKSIAVHAEIIDQGSNIQTEIRQNGVSILEYKTVNPYSLLKNVKIQIHYLNPGAKVSFKNITGYTSAEYGSIMMFLNGFRVMPYGEPKDDWLGLNQRKAQGTARNLGAREVFGRVEITDNSRVIIPVTSREGVENNQAFLQLSSYDLGSSKRGFVHSTFLALESYVVNGLDWDRVEPKDGNYSYEDTLEALLRSVEVIEKRNDLTDLKINETEIRKIARDKIADYENFVENLKANVSDKQVYDLKPAEKRQVKKFIDRLDTRLQAATASTEAFRKTAVVEKKRRLFLEAHAKPDSLKNKELIHHIGLLGDLLRTPLNEAAAIIQDINGQDALHTELAEKIGTALFNVGKLSKLTAMVSTAGFDMMSDIITEDILSYINQYIGELTNSGSTGSLNLSYVNSGNIVLRLSFSPLEISMLIDNIVENAAIAEAKKLVVEVIETDGVIELSFSNNGNKLSERYDAQDLFLFGITTTIGSGIGLAQVARVAKTLTASVHIANNASIGVAVKLRWNR